MEEKEKKDLETDPERDPEVDGEAEKKEEDDDGVKAEVGYVNKSKNTPEKSFDDVFFEIFPYIAITIVCLILLPNERRAIQRWRSVEIVALGIFIIGSSFLNRNK